MKYNTNIDVSIISFIELYRPGMVGSVAGDLLPRDVPFTVLLTRMGFPRTK